MRLEAVSRCGFGETKWKESEDLVAGGEERGLNGMQGVSPGQS